VFLFVNANVSFSLLVLLLYSSAPVTTIRVSQGGTVDVLRCDVPDTGSYAVPASALGYLGTGSGSTPATMQLTRSGTATDSASGVELLVTTAVTAQVPLVP
jgi:hypothetical protein